MSRIQGTTENQTLFLRAFRTHQSGPPPELWPSPAVFRRWLKSPAFRSNLETLLAALRFQTDLHLALAACHTARQITTVPGIPATPPDPNQLLRLHHLRQRFPAACGLADTKPSDSKPDSDHATKPPVETERQWVERINGKEGVQAYDRLVELWEEHDRNPDQHHTAPSTPASQNAHPPSPP
jgi:hypothetical protein